MPREAFKDAGYCRDTHRCSRCFKLQQSAAPITVGSIIKFTLEWSAFIHMQPISLYIIIKHLVLALSSECVLFDIYLPACVTGVVGYLVYLSFSPSFKPLFFFLCLICHVV